jgi:threonine dehydratase
MYKGVVNLGLTFSDIVGAHERISDKINRTPVLTNEVLDEMSGARLFFKCENLQKSGAFKARGATNAVFSLTDAEAERGVVTHSSGNHAAALARAGRLRSIPAYIVMPNNAPQSKQESVRRNGGEIVFCEPTLAARKATAAELMERTGAEFVHPYDDYRVMAGQGTTALEFLDQVPDLDLIVCPVGGGGHLSGIAVAANHLSDRVKVIGAEPLGADDALRSFRSGEIVEMNSPRTIADGLRTSLGERPFEIIRQLVDDIVTVSDEAIVGAMRVLWEELKIVVEPSGAVGYAVVRDGSLDVRDRNVGIVLTGGNLDLDTLPWQS